MAARTVTNEQILTWTLRRSADGSKRECAEQLREISRLAIEHSALLYRVAFSVVRHTGDAEDVVQETFLRVLRHQRKLQQIENPRVWLVRIAWNLALDRKRRLAVLPLAEEAEEILANRTDGTLDAEATVSAAEGCARILRLLDTLPRKEREVLRLSALRELDTMEIAAILGTSQSSVRSRLFRARQQLRKRMEQEEGSGLA